MLHLDWTTAGAPCAGPPSAAEQSSLLGLVVSTHLLQSLLNAAEAVGTAQQASAQADAAVQLCWAAHSQCYCSERRLQAVLGSVQCLERCPLLAATRTHNSHSSVLQYLDMRGRPGLLRTILEAQETRGLTRSDDISRLLPSEVCASTPTPLVCCAAAAAQHLL